MKLPFGLGTGRSHAVGEGPDDPCPAAARMVREQVLARGVHDARVLAAMRSLDRRMFVTSAWADRAYADEPLPIGHGQTISQPYIVGAIAEALNLAPHHRVLDVGTGSGYQAALLAMLCREVVSVERIGPLAQHAGATLAALRLSNVTVLVGDASAGVVEGLEGSFDRIAVAAAAPCVRAGLLARLGEGGILVAPEWRVPGDESTCQQQMLRRWRRKGDSFAVEDLFEVRFVPLVEDSALEAPGGAA